MRLPATASAWKDDDQEKQRRVQEVIEELGRDKVSSFRDRERGETERRERDREGKQVTSPSLPTPPHTLGYIVGGVHVALRGRMTMRRSSGACRK